MESATVKTNSWGSMYWEIIKRKASITIVANNTKKVYRAPCMNKMTILPKWKRDLFKKVIPAEVWIKLIC